MSQVEDITLTFEDNGRLHDDLVLQIGSHQWRCDSYFLWCENPKSDADYVLLVRQTLEKLIDQWIAALNRLRPGDSCFLPFDFSDQSTGWLRCNLENQNVVIQPGWSEIEGWSFAPSNIGKLLASVPDFKPTGMPFKIGRIAMLASLQGL